MNNQEPKLLPIRAWAMKMFGDYAPHPNTISKWVSNGNINPPPIKIGRGYFVSPDAKYVR